jgi:hypothetical protein
MKEHCFLACALRLAKLPFLYKKNYWLRSGTTHIRLGPPMLIIHLLRAIPQLKFPRPKWVFKYMFWYYSMTRLFPFSLFSLQILPLAVFQPFSLFLVLMSVCVCVCVCVCTPKCINTAFSVCIILLVYYMSSGLIIWYWITNCCAHSREDQFSHSEFISHLWFFTWGWSLISFPHPC